MDYTIKALFINSLETVKLRTTNGILQKVTLGYMRQNIMQNGGIN